MGSLKRLRRNGALLVYGVLATLDATLTVAGIEKGMSREEIESSPMVGIIVERGLLEKRVLYETEVYPLKSTRPVRNFIYWMYGIN